MSKMSSYYNQIRTERFRLEKLEKIKKGDWMGGPPPYGNAIDKKKLVGNPDKS